MIKMAVSTCALRVSNLIFPSCIHTDDLLAAHNSIIKHDSISSPVADTARISARHFKDWILLVENHPTVSRFLVWLNDELTQIIRYLESRKKFSAGREKMWTSFHKFCESSEFRKQWQDLMSQSLTEPVHIFCTCTSVLQIFCLRKVWKKE